MKFFSFLFLMIFTFSNFAFAEDKTILGKTSSQELQELDATDLQLCNVVCESEFSKCYKNDKKNALLCASKVLSCKEKCKKTFGK